MTRLGGYIGGKLAAYFSNNNQVFYHTYLQMRLR
jgi:hypothetical protein